MTTEPRAAAQQAISQLINTNGFEFHRLHLLKKVGDVFTIETQVCVRPTSGDLERKHRHQNK